MADCPAEHRKSHHTPARAHPPIPQLDREQRGSRGLPRAHPAEPPRHRLAPVSPVVIQERLQFPKHCLTKTKSVTTECRKHLERFGMRPVRGPPAQEQVVPAICMGSLGNFHYFCHAPVLQDRETNSHHDWNSPCALGYHSPPQGISAAIRWERSRGSMGQPS
ncbi:hypothetical protein P7K49_027222, partial [Saguinus oedipus]